MTRYRLYLRDADEQIISHGDTDRATDREARMMAESLLAPGEPVEVWDGMRRVHLIGVTGTAKRHQSPLGFVRRFPGPSILLQGHDDPANKPIAADRK